MEKGIEDQINKNYFTFTMWIIYNCFTDIGKHAHRILGGDRKRNGYWKEWYAKVEELKYSRMRFAKNSPLIGLWANCANIDEKLIRRRIIKFAIEYPETDCLKAW